MVMVKMMVIVKTGDGGGGVICGDDGGSFGRGDDGTEDGNVGNR